MLNSIAFQFAKKKITASPWSALFAGLLIGLGITFALQLNAQQQLLARQDQEYGKALVTLAARQAIDATLNHDLVSLQVILRDITQNPRVENATIHDIENHLLVQAGSTPNLGATSSLAFNAPIIFHESIAGYLTIVLRPEPLTPVTPGVLLVMIIATIGLVVSVIRRSANQSPAEGAPSQNNSLPVIEMTSNLDRARPRNAGKILVTLELTNLKRLQRQLSNPRLQGLLNQLEESIKGVTALYNGELIATQSDHAILLRFSAPDQASAQMNAAYAAFLLHQLQPVIGGIQLQLAIALLPASTNLSLPELLQSSSLPPPFRECEGQILIHASLDQSTTLQTSLVTEPWHTLTALPESAQALLARQLDQLLQHQALN